MSATAYPPTNSPKHTHTVHMLKYMHTLKHILQQLQPVHNNTFTGFPLPELCYYVVTQCLHSTAALKFKHTNPLLIPLHPHMSAYKTT